MIYARTASKAISRVRRSRENASSRAFIPSAFCINTPDSFHCVLELIDSIGDAKCAAVYDIRGGKA